MVVSFTPNIGLAKPSEAELAANWVNFTDLVEDNNTQIIDKMDVNVQTYNPVIVGYGGNPSLGAGISRGEFIDFQGMIMGIFIMPFVNPGILPGVDEMGVELPFEVDPTFHTVGNSLNNPMGPYSIIGHGFIYDSSSVATSGAVALDSVTTAPGTDTSYARLITETFTAPVKTHRYVTHNMPFAPADGDCFTGFFIFKKA